MSGDWKGLWSEVCAESQSKQSHRIQALTIPQSFTRNVLEEWSPPSYRSRGSFWRLVLKCLTKYVHYDALSVLATFQLGVSINGACEAIIHAVSHLMNSGPTRVGVSKLLGSLDLAESIFPQQLWGSESMQSCPCSVHHFKHQFLVVLESTPDPSLHINAPLIALSSVAA